jgi:hypothetical protein
VNARASLRRTDQKSSRTMKRYYYFLIHRCGPAVYIGKCETTEAEIRSQFSCSIEGDTVHVFAVRKGVRS